MKKFLKFYTLGKLGRAQVSIEWLPWIKQYVVTLTVEGQSRILEKFSRKDEAERYVRCMGGEEVSTQEVQELMEFVELHSGD